MATKITILCGSPRAKGNTNTVAAWVAQAATQAGADVETIDVAKLDFKTNGCTACMGCETGEQFECVIDDDASPILKRLPEADVILFATPVYFFGPTAQLKLLLDRMFSLIHHDPATATIQVAGGSDRTIALVATAGGGMNGGLDTTEQTFQKLADFTHQRYESLLVPNAPLDPAELADDAELKGRAEAFGKKLAEA